MSDADDVDLSLPMLVSEDYLHALLLDSIIEACATTTDCELKSWGRASYARAIRELAGAGFLDLQKEDGDDMIAQINAKGSAYIARLLAEEKISRKV